MEKNQNQDFINLLQTYWKQIVLKVKPADESINKYKTCLLAEGYTQKEDVNYEEMFSLIVRFVSICLILSTVA